MKKILTSVLAVALIAVMLFTLVSCGNKPSGTYGNKLYSVTFDGDKVTYTVIGSISIEGTFEMGEENKILVTWEDEGESKSAPSGWTYDKDADAIKFSLGVLGTVTLNKVEE